MRRRSSLDALVAVLLVGFSYPLVLYSSEARGYALAVFFALAGYDAMDRILRGGGWIARFVFVASSILGILSHFTFVFFYLGALAWHAASIRRSHRWGSFLLLHVIPISAVVMVYILFIRNLTIGGAPREGLLTGLLSAIGTIFGAGEPLLIAWITASCGMLLLGLSMAQLKRKDDPLWILLLVTVILAPAVIVGAQLLLVQQDNPIAARYFLVPGTFALLGIATLVSDWLSRSHAARTAGIVVLLGFVGINLVQTMLFFRGGRGHYRDAIAYISDNTPGDLITVLSDHPLRTGMVLDFYADRFLSPNQRLVIYDGSTLQRANFEFGPPLWIIVHSNKRNLPPEKLRGYVFDREFSYYGLSGYSWYLYHHHTLK
jgi:hypothetical protein